MPVEEGPVEEGRSVDIGERVKVSDVLGTVLDSDPVDEIDGTLGEVEMDVVLETLEVDVESREENVADVEVAVLDTLVGLLLTQYGDKLSAAIHVCPFAQQMEPH